MHGIAGYCQACWNIRNAHKIACTHHWVAFTNYGGGINCDFGNPIHVIASDVVGYTCTLCHIIAFPSCCFILHLSLFFFFPFFLII